MVQTTRRVVVTGIGLVTPLGCAVETVWDKLVAGESGVAEITQFDHSGHPVHIAAEVKNFTPTDYMDKRAARRMDPFAHYAVAAAKMAREDADFEVTPEAERVGAVVATGVGGLKTFEAQLDDLRDNHKGWDRINPLFIPMMIPNMGVAQVSLELGTKGPLSSVSTACAASSMAIGDAFELIRRNAADVMFAGGTEAPITPVGIAAFAAMRALSRRNDDPQHASRPFDAERDGFVMGEGGGVLVLEELEHALRRGAKIYAELIGYGLSSDAFHMTAPDDSGEPQARAMNEAMAEAGIEAAEIDYINAHGTATGPGDIAETKAIKLALGEHAYKVAISSTKSMMGHCLGGAGAIEAAISVLVIDRGVIPPTTNLTHPDPLCDLDFVPNTARAAAVSVAASNSFGFGGHNATLIFRRFVP